MCISLGFWFLIIHAKNTSCWNFFSIILHIGYQYCTDNSSYIFFKVVNFCFADQLYKIVEICILLGFLFLIAFAKIPAIKFGHLLAKYFVLRIPFPWKRSVLSVQGWQMNWVHTVHTKVDPVYCHIDSFLLLFFLYTSMFVFYRYIFMVLVCLFCYF